MSGCFKGRLWAARQAPKTRTERPTAFGDARTPSLAKQPRHGASGGLVWPKGTPGKGASKGRTASRCVRLAGVRAKALYGIKALPERAARL